MPHAMVLTLLHLDIVYGLYARPWQQSRSWASVPSSSSNLKLATPIVVKCGAIDAEFGPLKDLKVALVSKMPAIGDWSKLSLIVSNFQEHPAIDNRVVGTKANTHTFRVQNNPWPGPDAVVPVYGMAQRCTIPHPVLAHKGAAVHVQVKPIARLQGSKTSFCLAMKYAATVACITIDIRWH